MRRPRSAGRPKAISREMLEEAACELFLEQGYEDTSVVDITRRAGVSRATFFNYVDSKSHLLWASVDDVLDGVGRELTSGAGVVDSLRQAALDLQPGVAVLAIRNAEAMGVEAELLRTSAERQAILASVIAEFLRAQGHSVLAADVRARAQAGAFFAALESWARSDFDGRTFAEVLDLALAELGLEE